MQDGIEATDDLLVDAANEIRVRQHLTLVALGKRPADLAVRVGKLFLAHTGSWALDQEIIVSGRRIAWVGPAGAYRGDVAAQVAYPNLAAVPGFGEVHKHIESTHLTPEYEAALVVPRGNTWTCEASHEFANVNGARNLEFWLEARRRGSPLKIFVLPGSAVPPSAYEHGGGWYGYDEQRDFLSTSLMVTGLDEVMDWPAVWNPESPSYDRLWGMIRASFEQRGVVEGHGAGLRELPEVNAFSAAGITSDHEVRNAVEAWDKLARGIFLELRPNCYAEVIPSLLAQGLTDWSNIAFCTDDRSASHTLRDGAIDHNAREAIRNGLKPEIAIQCVTINPARHMRVDHWVGSIAPGRFADFVLLDDVVSLSIHSVYADGAPVSEGKAFKQPVPQIDWPGWATGTVNIGRALAAEDFRIAAAPGRTTMQTALLKPFHWDADLILDELPVADGSVERDSGRSITKFAIVDRYSGTAAVSRMFWVGCGPKTEDTALACSVGHDKHNIWVVGSSDAAMALAVNRLSEIGGGWALATGGKVIGEVRYEIGGLMTARPAEVLDAEMQALYRVAETIDWMFEPHATTPGVWQPGFPERLIFATLTCSPWRWVLVAPGERAPEGLVNVQTGETHPIVW